MPETLSPASPDAAMIDDAVLFINERFAAHVYHGCIDEGLNYMELKLRVCEICNQYIPDRDLRSTIMDISPESGKDIPGFAFKEVPHTHRKNS